MAVHIRKVAKRAWLSLLRVMLMLIIFIVLFTSMLILTEGGRIGLLKQGLQIWQYWSHQTLSLTGVRSPSIGEWQIAKAEWRGNALEPDFTARDIDIDWQWQYALQNRWWFNGIQIGEFETKVNGFNNNSGENFANLYELWSKIPSVRVDQINIKKLTIVRNNYPTFRAELNAIAELNWGAIPARFLLSLTDSAQNSYGVELSADAVDQFRLKGSLHAEPNSNWARWLKWSLQEPVDASWDVKIDYATDGELNLKFDQWRMPWKGHLFNMKGEVSYDIEQIMLEFNAVQLTLDNAPASLDGWIKETESDLMVDVDQWIIDPISEFLGAVDWKGKLTAKGQWFGGWLQPRFDGRVSALGQWRDQNYSFDVESVAEMSSLRLSKGSAELGANQFNLAGQIDWISEELSFDYTAHIVNDSFIQPYVPKILKGLNFEAEMAGSISGALESPVISYDTRLLGDWREEKIQATASGRWQNYKIDLSDIYIFSSLTQLSGDFHYDLKTLSWSSNVTVIELSTGILNWLNVTLPVSVIGSVYGEILVEGQGGGFAISGDARLQGLWQNLPINADLAIARIDKQAIQLDRANIRLGDARLDGKGNVNWRDHEFSLSMTHDQIPLSVVRPLIPKWPRVLSTLTGNMTGQTLLTGAWGKPAIKTNSEFQGHWFGEAIDFSLVTEPETNLLWKVVSLDGDWLEGQWHYQGDFKPYELGIDGFAQAEHIHASYVPMLSESFLGNQKQLPENLNVFFDADVSVGGYLNAPELTGNLSSYGVLKNREINVSADIGFLNSNYVWVDQSQGFWASDSWQFDGLYDWRKNHVAMTVQTDTEDVSHLTSWLRLVYDNPILEHWRGSLTGKVFLDNRATDWKIQGDLISEGQLYDEPYLVEWSGNGQLQEALNHNLTAEWAGAKVSAQLKSAQLENSEFSDQMLTGLVLEEIDTTISGGVELVSDLENPTQSISGSIFVEKISFEQLRKFNIPIPESISGDSSGNIQIEGTVEEISIDADLASSGLITNTEATHPWKASLKIDGTQNDWSVSKAAFYIPHGIAVTAIGTGAGSTGTLYLDAAIEDTAYWLPHSEIGPGIASIDLVASGSIAEPKFDGHAQWISKLWPLAINIDIETGEKKHNVNGVLLSEGQNRIEVKASTPINHLASWLDDLAAKPFSVAAEVQSPMSVLDPLFIDQPDQKLDGYINGKLLLDGTLYQPIWGGSLNWVDGRYEHAEYGSLVSDISLTLTGERNQWLISGKGTDGRQGKVKAEGSFTFIGQPTNVLGHSIDISVTAVKAALLNRAQMDASFSGAAEIKGSYHHLNVAGLFDVSPLNLQSDTFLLDGAPLLNIVNEDDSGVENITTQPIYWPRGQWDIKLNADNRANLYGQGITAELTGELDMTGGLYDRELSGQFEVIRGDYVGFGKKFTLQRGNIQIHNNQLVLDIEGRYVDRDYDVILDITGTQDALNLSLRSIPAMDQDELLALLLFGKKIEEMSPFLALQLATVVNRLRTGSTGFDLIGVTRDELTLDTLIVNTNTGDDGTLEFKISAGKYITDFLYFEVEQDTGSEQGFRSSLQYLVSPHTSVELYSEGSIGGFDDNGIELNWSLDY